MSGQSLTIPQDQCTLQTCSMDQAIIRHLPSVAGNLVCLAVFGLLLLLQVGMGIFYRTRSFLAGVAFCLVLEIVGYAGRVMMMMMMMMRADPFAMAPFLMYTPRSPLPPRQH